MHMCVQMETGGLRAECARAGDWILPHAHRGRSELAAAAVRLVSKAVHKADPGHFMMPDLLRSVWALQRVFLRNGRVSRE